MWELLQPRQADRAAKEAASAAVHSDGRHAPIVVVSTPPLPPPPPCCSRRRRRPWWWWWWLPSSSSASTCGRRFFSSFSEGAAVSASLSDAGRPASQNFRALEL